MLLYDNGATAEIGDWVAASASVVGIDGADYGEVLEVGETEIFVSWKGSVVSTWTGVRDLIPFDADDEAEAKAAAYDVDPDMPDLPGDL